MRIQPAWTCRATHGMVCAVDHLAAQAGVSMLMAGGSAADAAVATSAVLAVTAQHLCGMGGDLLAVVVPPRPGVPMALNASGRAGSGADPDRLRAEGHRQMPPRGDIRAVTVPGCVDGWLALHTRFGRLPLADVLAPAVRYADEGFPASPTLVASVPEVADLPDAADFTATPLRPGSVVRRPGVGRTLRAIEVSGRPGFYQGEFGEGLLRLGAGEFAPEDLESPLADWMPALATDGFGHRLWTVPPNSQGYLTLASAWVASGVDLPGDPEDPRWAHLLIEASRQAGYDRLDVLHEHADGEALVAPQRLQPRRNAIDHDRTAPLGDGYREGGTIALTAVDHDRLAIALLQSNAAGFGSHLIVPGVRIFLHDRGIGFSLQPGHPAEYGPRRRPPHTLSPAAVTLSDGALVGVLGTMGGDSQPQILVQLLARWLVTGESPGSAVAAGRWALTTGAGFETWHRRGLVHVLLEGHAPSSWRDGLEARGHVLDELAPFSHSFGHAHVIAVQDDHLAGGSDPRPRFGAALGY